MPNFGDWSLNYNLTNGGIILNDVRNQQHLMATDIRVLRVFCGNFSPFYQNPRNLVVDSFKLGSMDCPAVPSQPSILDSTHQAPQNFGVYPIEGGLEARYQLARPLFARQGGQEYPELSQCFLFSHYGSHPTHDPLDDIISAYPLNACRLFPLFKFSFQRPTNNIDPDLIPRFIRVDYRMELHIDNLRNSSNPIDRAMAALLHRCESTPRDAPSYSLIQGNQVGIFRDSNIPSLSISAILQGRLANMFEKAEKPLLYEIYGNAINTLPDTGEQALVNWDNIHIWPKHVDGSLVTTPFGGQNAIHCHWRYGSVGGYTGGNQYSGEHIVNGFPEYRAGDPLIDPYIPWQKMDFAITKNNRADWNANSPIFDSEYDFSNLFIVKDQNRPRSVDNLFQRHDLDTLIQQRPSYSAPEVINNCTGESFIYWFSLIAIRDEEYEEWGGTFFIHGIFFAHNMAAEFTLSYPEPLGRSLAQVAAPGPLYTPNPVSQIWRR